MKLNRLKIENFRNVQSGRLEFNDGINLFNGRNGAGKTNILEAIFVLILARSPRGGTDQIMINDQADYYRLEGEVAIDERITNVAGACQKEGRKKLTIDKVAVRAAELFDRFAAVAAAPHDIEIISGSPSKRRDFLNIYLSQSSINYLHLLTQYEKARAQKNAYLKQNQNTGDIAYDDLMIKYGSQVMQYRQRFIDALAKKTELHYHKISEGQKLQINYNPSVPLKDNSDDLEDIAKLFAERLVQNRERERIMQTSLVGPHRDDVDFIVRDLPARSHGSQGELRSTAVSLKLAVYEYLKEIKKIKPLLLLDEIFAELDRYRTDMMVELFTDFGQIFITSASKIPESLSGRAKKFTIDNGNVSEN